MTKGKYPNGVAAAMERVRIGQAELARQIGESRQQVGRWVHGERKLTPAYASKIAAALGVTAGELFMPSETITRTRNEDRADHPSAAEGLQNKDADSGTFMGRARHQPLSAAIRVGDALRQARRERGITMRQVAEAVGTDFEAIDSWETGEAAPSDAELRAAADVLRVEPSALARGELVPTTTEDLGNAVFISDEIKPFAGPRDVEKVGVVAAGDEGDFEFNGEVVEYIARPRGLMGRPGVFALTIISESMYPAYRKFDVVFCDRAEPKIGDDVVIETFPENGAKNGKSFVKRLKKRSNSELVVEQFNPPKDLTFDRYAIKHFWRVVPHNELHGY